MGFLGLCGGDPVVSTLREVFGANVLRIPEERIQPLTVLAGGDDRVSFRGALAPLLAGDLALPSVSSSQMPSLSGKRTAAVDFDLGLKILAGFLQGMGAGTLGLQAHFTRATKIAYSFENVVRSWVDLGLVGRALAGRSVDRGNPAARIFFGQTACRLLLVDSSITSSKFSIGIEQTTDDRFAFDVPAVASAIGAERAGITVSTATGRDLTFSGTRSLTFAFSCVELRLTAAGVVAGIVPDPEDRELYRLGGSAATGMAAGTRLALSPAPALIEIDTL